MLRGHLTSLKWFYFILNKNVDKGPTIPSIYLIGKNGVPLDIITGKDNLDNICQKIDNTLSKAGVNFHHISGVSGNFFFI